MASTSLEEVEAPEGPRRRTRHRFRRRVVFVTTLAVVAFLLVGFWPYVPVSISGQVWTDDHYCPWGTDCPAIRIVSESLPAGPNVTLHWRDVSGGIVEFDIWGGSGWPLRGWVPQCSGNSSSGGCSFNSIGGNYTFRTENNESAGPQLVDFTLSYFVSLL
jgi:hypothetical protein